MGSNPTGDIDVCLFCVCVLSGRGLCEGSSLIKRSSNDCGASSYVIKKPRGRGGHSPRWVAVPEKIMVIILIIIILKFASTM
jgi:hypothetical protein